MANAMFQDSRAKLNQSHLIYIIYSFVKDLDPCLDVYCASFGVCKTYSAHEARCVCNEDCPSYQDPVCTANGTTYDNKCLYELNYCKGMDNSTMYHPGSCEGRSSDARKAFSMQRDAALLSKTCISNRIPNYKHIPISTLIIQLMNSTDYYLNKQLVQHVTSCLVM